MAAADGDDWDAARRAPARRRRDDVVPDPRHRAARRLRRRLGGVAAAAARPAGGRPAHRRRPPRGAVPRRRARGPPGRAAAADRPRLAGRACPPVVRLVTLAPELDGASRPIAPAASAGAWSSPSATRPPRRAGRRRPWTPAPPWSPTCSTACRPFHHRDPGLAGAALHRRPPRRRPHRRPGPRRTPPRWRLAFRAKGPDGVALVTDAGGRRAPGRRRRRGPPGRRHPGRQRPHHGRSRPQRRAGGGRRRWPTRSRRPSTTPARLLGLADRGRLAPGARADLVALTADLDVEADVGRRGAGVARGDQTGARPAGSAPVRRWTVLSCGACAAGAPVRGRAALHAAGSGWPSAARAAACASSGRRASSSASTS